MTDNLLPIAAGYGCIDPAEMASYSGLEFFKRLKAGEIPGAPISRIVPMKIEKVSEGCIVWATHAMPDLLNPMGGVHGGYYMTVLDSCLGCAVHAALPAGRGYTTLEVKTNLIKPVKPDGTIYYAEGKVLKVGRRIGTSEARIYDEAGSLYAHGTSTCLIFDAPGL